MALIEVEDTELQALKQRLAAAEPSKVLLDKMGSVPKTRAQLLQLMKEINPNMAIPELDAAKPIYDALSEERAKREALEKKIADREADEAKRKQEAQTEEMMAKGQKYLRSQGCTDEGIAAVEKFMADRGLIDYEAGFALWEQKQPKEESVEPSNFGRSWDLFAPPEEDGDIKRAVSLPKGVAQENALKRWQSNEINKWAAERGQAFGRRR